MVERIREKREKRGHVPGKPGTCSEIENFGYAPWAVLRVAPIPDLVAIFMAVTTNALMGNLNCIDRVRKLVARKGFVRPRDLVRMCAESIASRTTA